IAVATCTARKTTASNDRLRWISPTTNRGQRVDAARDRCRAPRTITAVSSTRLTRPVARLAYHRAVLLIGSSRPELDRILRAKPRYGSPHRTRPVGRAARGPRASPGRRGRPPPPRWPRRWRPGRPPRPRSPRATPAPRRPRYV